MYFRYKVRPGDFIVEEVPRVIHPGREFLVLKVEKVGVSTLDVVEELSRRFSFCQKDVGYLGLKDSRAVAYQYLSIPSRGLNPKDLEGMEGDGFKVVEVFTSGKKLRAGHLEGNRFHITLRDVSDPLELERRLKEVSGKGFPNFFDVQRFGEGWRNLIRGLRLLREGKRSGSPYRNRLLISAVSSWFFNRYLLDRIDSGFFDRFMEGDLVLEEGSWVPLKFAENLDRCVPTGPILGYKMPLPTGKALEFERALMDRVGLDTDSFRPFGAKGSRRAIKVYPEGLVWRIEKDTAFLEFFLPAGSYATVMLKWLICGFEEGGHHKLLKGMPCELPQ